MFIGYEFDVGIHYVGEMADGRINRTLVDQISDGQVEWKELDPIYDIGRQFCEIAVILLLAGLSNKRLLVLCC